MIHPAAAEAVNHVALQNAVLNQHRALAGRAFVVHMDLTPVVDKRTVVDGGHDGRRNLLTELAAEFAHADAHAGGFQRMAARLVEDNAAEAVVNRDGHHTRGADRRMKHRHCLLGGDFS